MEESSVSFSKPKKKKSSSKEELVSGYLEETASGGSQRNRSFPIEESVSDPEESGNKSVPKKKGEILLQGGTVTSGPEEAAASKSISSKGRELS